MMLAKLVRSSRYRQCTDHEYTTSKILPVQIINVIAVVKTNLIFSNLFFIFYLALVLRLVLCNATSKLTYDRAA